jgi:hypothetical protein
MKSLSHLLAVVIILSLAGNPGAQEGSLPDPDAQAVAKASNDFLAAMAAGQARELADLGTDPFDFDGRRIKGLDPIMRHWERVLSRSEKKLKNLEESQIDIFGYKTAELKFGKPPKKFAYLNLRRCLFAAVTFEDRDGFLLIFKKTKKKWRVAAVTD